MTRQQIVHIGMINSFNIITGVVSLEQVISSGMSVIAHIPEEDELEFVNLMIHYFQEHEFYEYCSVLKKYKEDTYYDDGSRKEQECSCEYPEIKEYVVKTKCSKCNKRLFR